MLVERAAVAEWHLPEKRPWPYRIPLHFPNTNIRNEKNRSKTIGDLTVNDGSPDMSIESLYDSGIFFASQNR